MQNVGRSILNCSSTSVLLKRCKSTKLKQIRQISLNHHQICNEQLRFGNRRNFEEGLKSKLHLNIFLHFAILQNVKKRKWTFQFLTIDNCHAGSKIVHKLLVPLEIKCIVHRAAAFFEIPTKLVPFKTHKWQKDSFSSSKFQVQKSRQTVDVTQYRIALQDLAISKCS